MSVRDLFNIENKTVIVTGGAKGIGKAISYGLAEAGADVAIAARDLKVAEEVCRDIADRFSVRAFAIETDVGLRASVDSMVRQVIERLGRIDVVVSNAGIINRPRENAVDVAEAVWDRIIQVNLKGTFLVCTRVAKEMIPRKQGKIICMGSMLCEVAQEGHAPYIASKGGIRQLIKALALDLAPFNIQVNGLGPHYFKSAMIELTLKDEKRVKAILDKIPARRIGEPEDIVGSTIFLASKASDLVTGHLLMIDGGYTIQ